jgi:hypothetical protein
MLAKGGTMRKARIVRVAAAVLAVPIVVLLPCGAFAASGYTYTDRTVYFQRYSGGSWVDYVQKEYRLGGPDGPIIYCLEGGKYFSDGDLAEYIGQDAMVNILNADNAAGRLQDGPHLRRHVQIWTQNRSPDRRRPFELIMRCNSIPNQSTTSPELRRRK